jgi:ribosomal-protein-alanine N-acetyltransferase
MQNAFSFEISNASCDDAVAIAQIEKECFSMPWSEKSLLEFIENPSTIMLTAKSGNRLIGYVGAYLVIDQADIANVAVTSDFRRRGVAKALMAELDNQITALGLDGITLEVRASNTSAVSLYGSLGYSEIGRRRGYYRAPREDAIIMKKQYEHNGEQSK